MNTLAVGLSRFTAAACATVITAVSAWAFVSSSASIDRDPFRFASIMAANAKVRAEQQSAPAAVCRSGSETPDNRPSTPACLNG
jgi:hypothetical protein